MELATADKTTLVRRLVGGAAALVSMLSTTSTAPAHAADSGIARALDRIEAGQWSSADLALIRSQPEVAAQVPDPTDPGTVTQQIGTKLADSQPVPGLTAATTCGHWARVVYTKRSLTGSVIYAYGHYVQYCSNGSALTRWESRYDYLAQSSVVYWREPVVNKQAGIGTSSAWSHFQRHIEYCVVKYGCYANTYPWSKITVYGKGGYTYTGANA